MPLNSAANSLSWRKHPLLLFHSQLNLSPLPESKILFLFLTSQCTRKIYRQLNSLSISFPPCNNLEHTIEKTLMDLLEGVGESSSPPRSFGGYSNHDIRTDVYNRLVETGHDEAISNPDFREQLEAHFNLLPPRFIINPILTVLRFQFRFLSVFVVVDLNLNCCFVIVTIWMHSQSNA